MAVKKKACPNRCIIRRGSPVTQAVTWKYCPRCATPLEDYERRYEKGKATIR